MGPLTRSLRSHGRGDSPAPEVQVDPSRPGADLPRILCATDLSYSSERALAFASSVAVRFGAVLRALHVVAPGQVGEPTRELAGLLDRHRRTGLAAEVSIARGDVADEIVRELEEWPASLLVMIKGAHGAGAKEWALGSVTASVARRARCPVLTIPCLDAAEASMPAVVRRVLCGVDLGASSGATLALALSFARAFEAGLDLIHVLEWFTGESDLLNVPELHFDASEEARARLHRLLPPDPGLDDLGFIVAAGTPHREILRVARERRADLVVLGVHGRRSLDRSLPGVQLVHLRRQVSCPLLVVPAGADDPDQA